MSTHDDVSLPVPATAEKVEKTYSTPELIEVGTTVEAVQGRMLYGLYDMVEPDRRLP